MPSSSLLVGLTIVAQDFAMSQGETAWINTAGSLSSGSFLLLGGRLADIYGRKKVLVASYALSAIWSIIGGFAKNK
jgi:MFS family permease